MHVDPSLLPKCPLSAVMLGKSTVQYCSAFVGIKHTVVVALDQTECATLVRRETFDAADTVQGKNG